MRTASRCAAPPQRGKSRRGGEERIEGGSGAAGEAGAGRAGREPPTGSCSQATAERAAPARPGPGPAPSHAPAHAPAPAPPSRPRRPRRPPALAPGVVSITLASFCGGRAGCHRGIEAQGGGAAPGRGDMQSAEPEIHRRRSRSRSHRRRRRRRRCCSCRRRLRSPQPPPSAPLPPRAAVLLLLLLLALHRPPPCLSMRSSLIVRRASIEPGCVHG